MGQLIWVALGLEWLCFICLKYDSNIIPSMWSSLIPLPYLGSYSALYNLYHSSCHSVLKLSEETRDSITGGLLPLSLVLFLPHQLPQEWRNPELLAPSPIP